ncbi:hypothetical protein ACFLSQ_02860 [Bacteroidota bacterium]
MKKIILIVITMLWSLMLLAEEGILGDILPNKNQKFIIELVNGDILSGYVVEMVSHPEDGDGIKFSTELGTATIYEDQIKKIKMEKEHYRHNHRIFLLPTAEPIDNNHFIGNFELMLFYAGAGISDWVSITAGRSFIPGIRSDQQISLINTKVTVMEMPLNSTKKLSLALGANLGFVNHDNRLIHYYGVSTLTLNRSAVTAALFYKAGSEDYYRVNVWNNSIDLNYTDGSFGIALGLDTKFSDIHDLHFIGELWNSDVTKPTNTAVMLGLRLCNSKFSADFGLSFFTVPFVAPFCSFVWTPFN